MSKLIIALLNPTTTRIDNGMENVRMVCDQFGRCWRERGQRRMMRQEGYGYDRGYGYGHGRPHYNSYNSYDSYNSAPGIGIQVPGLSIGMGGGRW